MHGKLTRIEGEGRMNTIDRITKALENASPEQIEAVAADLGIATHVRPADVTAVAVSEWLVWDHMKDLTYDLLPPQSATDSIHKSISVVARDVVGLARARGADIPDEWPDGSCYKRATWRLARQITYLLDGNINAGYISNSVREALCYLDAIAREHGATLAEIMDAS